MFLTLTHRRTVTAALLLFPLLALLGLGAVARADQDEPVANGLSAGAGDPLDSNDFNDDFIIHIGDDLISDPLETPDAAPDVPGPLDNRSFEMRKPMLTVIVTHQFGLPVVKFLFLEMPTRRLEAGYAR
jgi:hypothetical protein